MGSLEPPQFDVKKVAVIGAGPCGLAAAKYLKAQGSFDAIDVFEQQPEVGGIWYYSHLVSKDCPVPQEDPFYPPDPPVHSPAAKAPIFPSALYDRLCANIPGSLMGFSDHGFPEDALLFPSREMIQQVLVSYADDIRHMIKFSTEVSRVTMQVVDGRDRWTVDTRSTVGLGSHQSLYDAVVVANGHYSIPHIPDMKGIKAFDEAHPGVISHAKQYRTSEPFTGKKVVIVGNGPSGVDVAAQINAVCQKPALLSVRSPTTPALLEHTGCEEVPEIEELLPGQRGVRFVDGRVEEDVDALVFCTGYMFSYPFLPELQHQLITDGKGVHGLYKHFLHIDHPTLVFPSLNMKAIPWPVAEAQAAVFSALWSNQLDLPAEETMRAWTRQLEDEKGPALHMLDRLADGYFINELHDWAQSARRPGKQPPFWNDELFWQRSIFAQAKLRFELQGRTAKTLEDIGFHYEQGAFAKSLESA